jgi:transglutaminase-like putative cysteine protease
MSIPNGVGGENEKPKLNTTQSIELEKLLKTHLDEQLSTSPQETVDTVSDIINWRRRRTASNYPFFDLFETMTYVDMLKLPPELKEPLLDSLGYELASNSTNYGPRITALYIGMLDLMQGNKPLQTAEYIDEKLEIISTTGALEAFCSASVSYTEKLDLWWRHLAGFVAGLEELDELDARSQSPIAPPMSIVPEIHNDSEGMPAENIWGIYDMPAKFWRIGVYDEWDADSCSWVQSSNWKPLQVKQVKSVNVTLPSIRNFKPTNKSIPLPAGWFIDSLRYGYSIEEQVNRSPTEFFVNDEGAVIVKDLPEDTTIYLKRDETYVTACPDEMVLQMPGEFSDEVYDFISGLDAQHLSHFAKATRIVNFVRSRLTYSSDTSFNNVYATFPNGYLAAIDTYRMADCDVANTYCAALLSMAGFKTRLAIGYTAGENGMSYPTKVLREPMHAWLEVWIKDLYEWVPFDGTPPSQKEAGPVTERDSEPEKPLSPVLPSLQKLSEMRKNLTVKANKFAKPLYSEREMYFSEAAEISPSMARQLLLEIEKVERELTIRGERLTDILSRFWELLIEDRIEVYQSKVDNVLRTKKDGGDLIQDPVGQYLGILSGDYDAATRELIHEELMEVPTFGGLDLILCLDRSGSMSSVPENFKYQRNATFIVISSLHKAAIKAERYDIPLNLRTAVMSFNRFNGIVTDKQIDSDLTPKSIARLWYSTNQRGDGNADVALLQKVSADLKKERETGNTSKQAVVVFSDGMPEGPELVQELVIDIGNTGATVVGIGVGALGHNVQELFDTPASQGVVANNPEDIVMIMVRHVIEQAAELATPGTKEKILQMLESYGL